jgi:hypothetical protein
MLVLAFLRSATLIFEPIADMEAKVLKLSVRYLKT